jgi:hypothetical protein
VNGRRLPSAAVAASPEPGLPSFVLVLALPWCRSRPHARTIPPHSHKAIAATGTSQVKLSVENSIDRTSHSRAVQSNRVSASAARRRNSQFVCVGCAPQKLSIRFIHLDYLEVPKYANLWEGRCHRLPGLKHAPFWEAPDVFDELLGRYIDDVAAR